MQADPRIEATKAAIRRAKLYHWTNRIVRWTEAAFLIAVATLLASFWVTSMAGDYYGMALGLPTAACLLLSGVTYLVTLTLREMLSFGWTGWHFSVRSLLILTTWVAVVLGLIVWGIR